MKPKLPATAAFVLLTALTAGSAWAEEGRPSAATSPKSAAAAPAAAPSLALADVLGTPAPVWLTDCCFDYQACLAACPPVGQHGHVACVGACNSAYRGCC
jgi:hypothetical protein